MLDIVIDITYDLLRILLRGHAHFIRSAPPRELRILVVGC